ncbi:hypothetical protein RIM91_34450, partial [Pseudomonas aeruginosa]|nr:hypothetical protein [Pseudomonas aeruginosa]
YRLWLAETNRLEKEYKKAELDQEQCKSQLEAQKGVVDQHRQRYLRVGGAGIDQLRERIADWVRECDKRSLKAEQYQLLAKGLGLADELSAAALKENQQHIAARLEILDQQ